MRILRDFHCPTCEHEFEALTPSEEKHAECPECTSEQAFVVYKSMNFALDGTDPGFPTAYDAWAKRHEVGGKLR